MKQYGKRYEPESGDVDYEYHHIIKGLYATFSSWHIDHSTFNNLSLLQKLFTGISCGFGNKVVNLQLENKD